MKALALFLTLVACGAPPVAPSPPGPTAMVVGTAHRGHMKIADYPLTKLDALLRAYQPDLVLVEIRPEAFAEGHYEDGPFEMGYVTLLAKARGIAVEPIDWYLDADVDRDWPDPDADAAAAYERELGAVAKESDSYATFDVLNSPERALQLLAVRNGEARYGIGYGVHWHQRQAWFHYRAERAIARHGPRRVAAFVGFSHRPELAIDLQAHGRTLVDPRTLHADPTGLTVPADVLRFWKEGIDRMSLHRDRFSGKIHAWELALAAGGRCCERPAP